MSSTVQWAVANSQPDVDDDTDAIVSPRTVTPKASYNRAASKASPTRAPTFTPLKKVPSRTKLQDDDHARKPSPLRAEFRTDGEDPVSRGDLSNDGTTGMDTEIDGFHLQEAPKGKRLPSGYFSLQHTLPQTEETRDEIGTLPEDLDNSVRPKVGASGTHTPVGRRSVQFARAIGPDSSPDGYGSPKSQSTRLDDEADGAGKQASLFARLKSLTTSNSFHARHASLGADSITTPYMTPASERGEPRFPAAVADGSEAEGEADVEESSGGEEAERPAAKPRKKRRRWLEGVASTAPTTPRTARFPTFTRDTSDVNANSEPRPGPAVRRATMTDIPEDSRAGVSEDEGRDRLAQRWRRGLEGARGLSHRSRRDRSESPTTRRPTGIRRLTAFTNLDGAGSPFRSRMDRPGSLSAQRWRQVKAGLKRLGREKKDPRIRVDYQKSAELMAELLAGVPAALFLASMFGRDEHGKQKIPALLEQLKITIPSSTTLKDKSGDRHLVFEINLEYGNGPSRMTWSIWRSLRDFVNLHVKYKVHSGTERFVSLRGDDKRAKIPKFPFSAFPYLRGLRLRNLTEEDFEDEDAADPPANPEVDQSGNELPASAKKRRPSSLANRTSSHKRKPSSLGISDGNGAPDSEAVKNETRDAFADRQRKRLEAYLQQMIRWLIFRPDSTRLCKFLELSSLAMRLSVEGGYHGKEGLLTITSRRAIERHGLRAIKALPNRLKTMPDRHKPKWFMVRDSYVVAVDSPESLIPCEVFLVDADFSTDRRKSQKRLRDQTAQEMAQTAKSAAPSQHHILKLYNSERKLRLLARNERQLAQFKESIEAMRTKSVWAQKQRFESFAPVRKNVFARWLVDGRDHMWQVSRAMENARSFIYIHDWWLSPELYMRRPAAISQGWRLDRLLLEKAQQGVKVFIIVYRNIESAIPIDSEHTKAHMLELHPNICVQRSPNQFRQNQFFWAHHEKLVVIDNAMAFVGGVDLCFGRWDDSHHILTDDKLTGFENDFQGQRNALTCQLWPGKDYSNPRVQDFYALDQPYEEMYDRSRVPRMPWHDIAMCIVGQPARDVARHFVQRWNYIVRQRTPSRPTPTLLPPPEFDEAELAKLDMQGTCQIQILRSCTTWSIGTPNKTECSIMNAYVHLIRGSEHFVYIENQFFISSCTVEGTRIHNKIGDALVERIELAYERGENWRACLIIPLMPGFQSSVDSQDGTSVRLIMQCQYRSICRGETSIFHRLRTKGIEPSDYIEFYALRQWGKIGPKKSLTTEQLYIHAKCMIVDDRAAIIGSANINERSMLGHRDSEVAAVIVDEDTMDSYMGGKPYRVGVFPHTLRMRLMREHLGIDVDELYQQDDDISVSTDADSGKPVPEPTKSAARSSPPLNELKFGSEQSKGKEGRLSADSLRTWINKTGTDTLGHTFSSEHETKSKSYGEKVDHDVAGYGVDNAHKLAEEGVTGGRESYIDTHGHEVLIGSPDNFERRRSSVRPKSPTRQQVIDSTHSPTPPWKFPRMTTAEQGLTQLSQLPALPSSDDTDIGGPPITRSMSTSSAGLIKPLLSSMRRPVVTDNCMQDPLVDSFYNDIWHKVAENNTKLYRHVFRCMPDSEVVSWKEYREYNAYGEKFMQSQGLGQSKPKPSRDAPHSSGPPGSAAGTESIASEILPNGTTKPAHRLSGFANKLLRPTSNVSEPQRAATPEMSEKTDFAEKSGLGGSTPDPAGRTTDGQFDEKAELARSDAQSSAFASPEPGKQVQSPDPEKAKETQTRRSRNITFSTPPLDANDPNRAPETTATQSNGTPDPEGTMGGARRRRRAGTKSSMRTAVTPDEVLGREEAEELLNLVQGHLVLWPYDWLEKEERSGNWLYNIDQIAPLEIYD